MKHFLLSLCTLLLVGCGDRNTPTTVQYAADPVEEAADPSQSDESDVDDDDESHYLWNSKSTFRITYNNNRPIHGFRVHCEGTQYIYDSGISTVYNLVFTNVKTGKSFKLDEEYIYTWVDDWEEKKEKDMLIPKNLPLKYIGGETRPGYDDTGYSDIFWFVDLDFDGQVELVTGNQFINYNWNYGFKSKGEDYFNRFYRIVDGELVDATKEFIAKNEDLFKDRFFTYAIYVDKKRREIGLNAGYVRSPSTQSVYSYEEDGTYRLDRLIRVEVDYYLDGRPVRTVNITTPNNDTLRRYKFTDAEFKYRLKNVEGFIENL